MSESLIQTWFYPWSQVVRFQRHRSRVQRQDELTAAIQGRVRRYEAGDRDAVISSAAAAEATELMGKLPLAGVLTEVDSGAALAWFYWYRGTELASPDVVRVSALLFRKIHAVQRGMALPADIDILFAAQDLAGRLDPNTAMDFAREASRRGDLDSVNWAVIVLSEAVALAWETGVSAACLVYGYLVGQQLVARYRLRGQASDLDAAVDALSRARRLGTGDDRALAAAIHGELGTALLFRYQAHNRRVDLDAAVRELHDAHGLVDQLDPKWFWLTLNLGSALFLAADYPTAEDLLSRALSQCPDDGWDAATMRLTLGRVRCHLYRSGHRPTDLDAGVRDLQVVYSFGLRSSGPDAVRVREDAATLLASALFDCYDLDNQLSHLDEAARLLTERLELATGRSARLGALRARSEMYLQRFHRVGELDAVAAAIAAADEILVLAGPDGHAAASIRSTLAEALSERYRISANVDDLNRAIEIGSAGARLSSGDHHISCLLALGSALTFRASAVGLRADADQAVRALTSALDLLPAGSPRHSTARARLGDALATRARLFGGTDDADAAVALFREAVTEMRGWRVHAAYASALVNRAMVKGGLDDLNEAVSCCREAASIAPEHDRHSALHYLAAALEMRAKRIDSRVDRDAAIEAGAEALRTMPPHHESRPECLSNLAMAYANRSKRRRVSDLDKSIDLMREAVEIVQPGHGRRPILQANLAVTLAGRFTLTARIADFNAAVDYAYAALAECPEERVERAQLHYMRAQVFLIGAKMLPCVVTQPWPIVAAQDLRMAADAELASPVLRVVALRTLAELATDPKMALRSYEEIIPLTPLLVSHRLGRTEREELLAELKSVFRDAVATALDADQPERAVELLEYGRSIYWSQTVGPDLDPLPSPYSQLRPGITEGAIVMINIAQRRSDALALTPDGLHVIHLTNATPAEVETHATRYIDALANMEIDGATRALGPLNEERWAALGLVSRGEHLDMATTLVETELEWLWKAVAEPILKALGHVDEPADGSWPRIWWCPTGLLAYLPLHAAGRYIPTVVAGACVIDRVVSSYTPSVRALIAARRRSVATDRRVLVIAMPETPGLPALPDASDDIAVLTEKFGARTTVVTGSETNREVVCAALREHSWAHFTCHGVFEPLDPMLSGLRLHSETLTVADILGIHVDNAEFAFLSSCNTAVSGYRLPDDAVNISAALHAAGFRHVVAATWIVLGRYASFVADHLYSTLAADRDTAPAQCAVALHRALRDLRAHPDMELGLWIPFIHIGP